jgi:RNase P subunit RPR2
VTTLINWIRQWFCDHVFEYDEVETEWSNSEGGYYKGTTVSRTCKKCGWHKAYRKWS